MVGGEVATVFKEFFTKNENAMEKWNNVKEARVDLPEGMTEKNEAAV